MQDYIATLFILVPVFSWDLSIYNISTNYYVSSVGTLHNRAFLALPRSSCFNNVTNPTLVEALWFNEQPFMQKKDPFYLESQQWNNCGHLQDAISLDVEPLRSRLWVLDKGTRSCAAKLVIYDLFQKLNYSIEAPEAVQNYSFLLVDTDPRLNGARAYLGLDQAGFFYVFSLGAFKWKKIELVSSADTYPISTQFLAFARKEQTLFLTGGKERGLFALDLSLIRKEFDEDAENVTVKFLGEKLGDSSGLVSDFKDGITYYVPRDYVVVRWNSRKPAKAEYYNVLAQSYNILPYVSQLLTGPHNGIWAVANPGPPNGCLLEFPQLDKRLVKILKYNVFV